MKPFEFFIQKSDVKRQPPDRNLSVSLLKDSESRFEYAKSTRMTEENAKYVFENIYESVREVADSILILEGFKSYSHEATISFLQKFSVFSFENLDMLDRLRRKRNGMKYYGERASLDEAREAMEFCTGMLRKLKELHQKVLEGQKI